MRRRSTLMRHAWTALLLVGLACGVIPQGTSSPTTAAPDPAAEPSPPPTPTAPAAEIVVTLRGSEFHLATLDGALIETRSAEGLAWARPNTAQVVGDDIYYVRVTGPEGGGVVRRVSAGSAQDLEFTGVAGFGGLTFAVSPDGGRILWATTSWADGPPHSRLWMAAIDGSGATLVAESDPADEIFDYYLIEAVTWLANGDPVYAWQVSGIGGYILFFGWSSLVRYDSAAGNAVLLTPDLGQGAMPCWSDVTSDGALALGACGPGAQIVERETGSRVETGFPLLTEQGQAGAAAYSPSAERLAYGIARGNPDDERGQLVVVDSRAAPPRVIGSHAPGAFDQVEWVDDERILAGYWQDGRELVDLFLLDGTRSLVAEGRLIGVIRR